MRHRRPQLQGQAGKADVAGSMTKPPPGRPWSAKIEPSGTLTDERGTVDGMPWLCYTLTSLPMCLIFVCGLAQAPADSTFRITPLRPVAELEKEALAAQPPREAGDFRAPELVELIKLDPAVKLDIRYATTNNFLSTPMYSEARAFLQRPAAEALVRALHSLKAKGYGLLIHDAYRPWYVTKMFWEATPEDKRIFVADPKEGSKHNRGCAVDLTLYDLKTGAAVKMPSGYDEMSQRAYADYSGGTAEERERRLILRQAMEQEGFTVYPQEWWHFDYKDWRQYPILNIRFEQIPPRK
ncbi:MAG TPA: M15 family metallopeptidase [Candidatus Angelobacter sp.]|nr:M15 family metallopeptidase [Candidatus Angelobacter sp.]